MAALRIRFCLCAFQGGGNRLVVMDARAPESHPEASGGAGSGAWARSLPSLPSRAKMSAVCCCFTRTWHRCVLLCGLQKRVSRRRRWLRRRCPQQSRYACFVCRLGSLGCGRQPAQSRPRVLCPGDGGRSGRGAGFDARRAARYAAQFVLLCRGLAKSRCCSVCTTVRWTDSSASALPTGSQAALP
jgi:hypothetical protein